MDLGCPPKSLQVLRCRRSGSAALLSNHGLASQVLQESGQPPTLPFTYTMLHISDPKSGCQQGWPLQTSAPPLLPPRLPSRAQILPVLPLVSLFSLQGEELQGDSQRHPALYPAPSDGLQWMLRKRVKEGKAREIRPGNDSSESAVGGLGISHPGGCIQPTVFNNDPP